MWHNRFFSVKMQSNGLGFIFCGDFYRGMMSRRANNTLACPKYLSQELEL